MTTSHIRLLQPQTGPRNRWITKVTVRFDGRSPIYRKLTRVSRLEPGQVIHFPSRTFKTMTITIDATSSGIRQNYNGLSGVGFAEVTIPGVAPVVQTLRMPTALLQQAGTSSIDHALVILMNRIRAANVPPRSDPELDMSRSFTLPTARTFSIGGTMRISAKDPDPVIDQLVGRTPVTVDDRTALDSPAAEVVFTNSSGRLPGDLAAGAYAAIDGNPATSWMPGFGDQVGGWLQYSFDRPITFDHLNLQLVTDGRHSIPTEITITTSAGSRVVQLPAVPDGKGRAQGSTTSVPVSFPAISGQTVRITIDKVRALHELDYYSTSPQTFPVGIAEIGIPGVVPPPNPAAIPSQCFSDLLSIDGTPIDIEVSGTSSNALSSGALTISGCGNSAKGITLSAGRHVVQTSPYQAAGLDVDALWLTSAAGGAAQPLTSIGTIPDLGPPVTSTPAVKVLGQDRTHLEVKVTGGNGSPFWLVLGQSQSKGWKASIKDGRSFGSSSLIDGYANGWLISGARRARHPRLRADLDAPEGRRRDAPRLGGDARRERSACRDPALDAGRGVGRRGAPPPPLAQTAPPPPRSGGRWGRRGTG